MIGIYHSKDFDGVCSGTIMKHRYPDIELIGYDYGEPFPWDRVEGQEVIMADVSLPMDDMVRLAKESASFLWIDHHISAIKDFVESTAFDPAYRFLAYLDSKFSACELCWKHFFPEREMPKIVEYLGRYDRWDKSDPTFFDQVLLPFQYGMRASFSLNVEFFPTTFFTILGDHPLEVLINSGKAVLSYQARQNAQVCEQRAFDATIYGLRAICCNGIPHNSQSFDSVYDAEVYKLMVAFSYDGNVFTFSLYTTHEDVDCSQIAKRFGGGGHRKAAGFKLNPAETATFFVYKILGL